MKFNASQQPTPSMHFSEDGTLLTCRAIILGKIEGLGALESERLEYSKESVDSKGPLSSAYGNFYETQKALCYALVHGQTLSGQAADARCCSIISLPRSSEATGKIFKLLG
jgi:hypothetical protein